MSIAALEAVARLVQAGATVVGPKPERTVSLMDYPRCDEQLARLSEELWGTDPGESGRADRRSGTGCLGQDGPDGPCGRRSAAGLRVPDREWTSRILDYIHRRLGDRDVYFVCNQSDREVEAECLVPNRRQEARALESADRRHPGQPAAIRKQADERTYLSHSRRTAVGSSSFAARACRPQPFLAGPTVAGAATGGPLESHLPLPLGRHVRSHHAAIARLGGAFGRSHSLSLRKRRLRVRLRHARQGNPSGRRLMLDLGRVEDVGIARVRSERPGPRNRLDQAVSRGYLRGGETRDQPAQGRGHQLLAQPPHRGRSPAGRPGPHRHEHHGCREAGSSTHFGPPGTRHRSEGNSAGTQ